MRAEIGDQSTWLVDGVSLGERVCVRACVCKGVLPTPAQRTCPGLCLWSVHWEGYREINYPAHSTTPKVKFKHDARQQPSPMLPAFTAVALAAVLTLWIPVLDALPPAWAQFKGDARHSGASPTIVGPTGANATCVWAYDTGNYVVSSPAVGGDGTVFIGAHVANGSNVLAINGSTGALVWSFRCVMAGHCFTA